MRKNQSSLSAAGIAIARAIESQKPAGQRICYDPYARLFVPNWMYYVFGFFITCGYTEWRSPGVNAFLVARDRYIDDELQNYLEKGLEQLVILGAGYDSRAYRFNLQSRVKTFEVDHPATQQHKLKKLARIFDQTPNQVIYVPVDFNTQTLEERLPGSGYDPKLKTLFIWQGVTMYLKPDAVDTTLSFVVKYSAAGSAIVFDYIYSNVLEGVQKQNEIKSMQRYRFMIGEGLIFGIEEGCIETFLKQRGFRQARDMNSEGLKQTYFTGINAVRKVAGGYGIVTGIT